MKKKDGLHRDNIGRSRKLIFFQVVRMHFRKTCVFSLNFDVYSAIVNTQVVSIFVQQTKLDSKRTILPLEPFLFISAPIMTCRPTSPERFGSRLGDSCSLQREHAHVGRGLPHRSWTGTGQTWEDEVNHRQGDSKLLEQIRRREMMTFANLAAASRLLAKQKFERKQLG